MNELNRMIAETREWRDFHAEQFRVHRIRGASIEAAACAIREKALLDAKAALTQDKGPTT